MNETKRDRDRYWMMNGILSVKHNNKMLFHKITAASEHLFKIHQQWWWKEVINPIHNIPFHSPTHLPTTIKEWINVAKMLKKHANKFESNSNPNSQKRFDSFILLFFSFHSFSCMHYKGNNNNKKGFLIHFRQTKQNKHHA